MYHHLKIYIVFLSVILLCSCTNDVAPLVKNVSDYPADIGYIFLNKCATSGCHNDKSYMAAGQFNMSTYSNLFKGSVNGSPVIPFRNDFSILCNYINTFPALGLVSVPTMPLNETPLSKDELSKIKTWITNGAPDKNGKIMWQDVNTKYYITNQACDVVTVFDAETQLPIKYITVGIKDNVIEVPHMIRVSPDNKYWYVIFTNNNVLQKFSTTTDQLVAQVDLGNDQTQNPCFNWNTMVISKDSKWAYCVSWQQNSRIAQVDLENMKLLKNFGGTTQAHGCALNDANDMLYVTAQYGNFIYKIDTGFTQPPQQITLDGSIQPKTTPNLFDPHQIVFSPNGLFYFVSCQASNEVRVLNANTDVLVKTIKTGKMPLEMVINDQQQKLFVTCEEEPTSIPLQKGCVSVIDINTPFNVVNINVGYEPHGIDIDVKNNQIIVASRNVTNAGPAPHHTSNCNGGRNGFVNFINLQTLQVNPKKIELASDPYFVGVKN